MLKKIIPFILMGALVSPLFGAEAASSAKSCSDKPTAESSCCKRSCQGGNDVDSKKDTQTESQS